MRPPLLLLALLTLAACANETTEEVEGITQVTPPAEATTGAAEPTAARMEDGVQVVEIEAGPYGYEPASVALEAGVPARLVFTRTVDSDCSSQVKVPAFDVAATDLPMDEPVAVEFTPTQGGDYTFVCGMDMQRGTLVVQS